MQTRSTIVSKHRRARRVHRGAISSHSSRSNGLAQTASNPDLSLEPKNSSRCIDRGPTSAARGAETAAAAAAAAAAAGCFRFAKSTSVSLIKTLPRPRSSPSRDGGDRREAVEVKEQVAVEREDFLFRKLEKVPGAGRSAAGFESCGPRRAGG